MSEEKDGSPNDANLPDPGDLEDLDKRLRDAQHDQQRMQEPQESRGAAMGMAFRLSTELVAGLVVGGFIGWALDRWLGTSPLFLLVFFFLGMAAGIMNVVRTSQQMNKDLSEANENSDKDE